MIQAIIVDDDPMSREILSDMLHDHCPEIELLAMAESAKAARELLDIHKPNVVFLDIEMPVEDGLEFLKSLETRDFQVVFVSSHKQYAIDAFQLEVEHYIVKPVTEASLKKAVRRLQEQRSFLKNSQSNLDSYKEDLKAFIIATINEKQQTSKSISLPHSKGFKLVKPEEIFCLEADGNYTTVFLEDGKIVVSKTLKEFEEILTHEQFFRAHRSFILNLNKLTEFTHENGGFAILSNGQEVPVSRRKVSDFFDRVNSRSKSLKRGEEDQSD